MTTVNRSLETPLGKYAMEKVNDALTLSEDYLEKYLPPTEEELKDNIKGFYTIDQISNFKSLQLDVELRDSPLTLQSQMHT